MGTKASKVGDVNLDASEMEPTTQTKLGNPILVVPCKVTGEATATVGSGMTEETEARTGKKLVKLLNQIEESPKKFPEIKL